MRIAIMQEDTIRNPFVGFSKPGFGVVQDLSESVATKVSVKDLNLWYGPFQALHGITLELPVKRISALIGPSGCGKSSFLRSLNRLNDLTEGVRITGSVTLDGEDIYAPKADITELRKKIGMVFQKPNPFPMSIYENVAFGPRTYGVSKRSALDGIIEQSLRQAALWFEVRDKLKKSALGLSGGQQQRLCIARVLAVAPEVILMDEPCSALDPISTGRIEELMGALSEEYTVAIVTHNLQQAARVASQTAFFMKGHLIEVGPTEQVFTRPENPETEAYITGRFG